MPPIKVKELVVQQVEKIEQLEQRLKELEVKSDNFQEKANFNSNTAKVLKI